jgi:hypothetical protein
MIDWYMLLAPLVVLPIVLLFAFVGCSLEQYGGLEPLQVTLQWSDPLGDSWPGADRLKFEGHLWTSTWTENESVTSAALEPLPYSVNLGFGGAPYEEIMFQLGCTALDASGKEVGKALPPCPVFCTKKREAGDWLFKLEVTGIPSGPTKIVKIVDKTI